jgi:hypothetical protein
MGLRTFHSMLVDPGRPPRDGVALRRFLARWLGPAIVFPRLPKRWTPCDPLRLNPGGGPRQLPDHRRISILFRTLALSGADAAFDFVAEPLVHVPQVGEGALEDRLGHAGEQRSRDVAVTANTADAGGSSTILDNTAKWTGASCCFGPAGLPDE